MRVRSGAQYALAGPKRPALMGPGRRATVRRTPRRTPGSIPAPASGQCRGTKGGDELPYLKFTVSRSCPVRIKGSCDVIS